MYISYLIIIYYLLILYIYIFLSYVYIYVSYIYNISHNLLGRGKFGENNPVNIPECPQGQVGQLLSTLRNVFQIKPKSDCIYHAPIDLEHQTDAVRLLFKIIRCMVNTIWFRFHLIILRKYFSVCEILCNVELRFDFVFSSCRAICLYMVRILFVYSRQTICPGLSMLSNSADQLRQIVLLRMKK